jgi:hypothetical protein
MSTFLLKHVVDEFEALCAAIPQVNTYLHGELLDVFSSKGITHTSIITRFDSATVQPGEVTVTIQVACMDKVLSDNSNYRDVENSTLQILAGIENTIRYSTRWNELGRVTTPPTATKVIDRTADILSGWIMTLQLNLNKKNGICDLPIYDYDFGGDYSETCSGVTIIRNGVTIEVVNSGGVFSFVTGGGEPIDISINGVLVAEQVTENQNIPVTQGGEPVGSWDGEKWVVPECAPCEDATVNVNNTLFDTVESGNTLDIEVRKSTGNDLIGSKQGQFWRVGDSSINVNGDNLTDVKATDTLNISVVDSTDSPVAVTLSGGNKITVPSLPCGAGLNTANATKTGSVTSYRTGDSADTNRGRLNTFAILDFMNPFGNNQRFTGITGGYNVGTDWFDKDGNATTEALAIPEDVVLDWAQWNNVGNTVLGIYRVPVTGDWNACVDACLAVATTTFPTGWAIINFIELAIIRRNDTPNGGVNYRPFSITIIGTSTRIYAGDTNPNGTTAAYNLNEFGALGSMAKTTSARGLAARVITLAELGL